MGGGLLVSIEIRPHHTPPQRSQTHRDRMRI